MAENDCQGEDAIAMLVDQCDREASQALGMVPTGDGPWKPVTDHYRKYARAIIEAYATRLQDPAAVHANMLHGTIAKISMDQCAHTHGVQFNDIEAAEAKLTEVSQERDRLREALAPFAKDGDRFPYDSILVTSFGDPTAVTTGDLRRARAALNKEPPCQET